MRSAPFVMRAAGVFLTTAIMFAALIVIAHSLKLPSDKQPFLPATGRNAPDPSLSEIALEDSDASTTAARGGGPAHDPVAVVTAEAVPRVPEVAGRATGADTGATADDGDTADTARRDSGTGSSTRARSGGSSRSDAATGGSGGRPSASSDGERSPVASDDATTSPTPRRPTAPSSPTPNRRPSPAPTRPPSAPAPTPAPTEEASPAPAPSDDGSESATSGSESVSEPTFTVE
jgi:hypothetical protein